MIMRSFHTDGYSIHAQLHESAYTLDGKTMVFVNWCYNYTVIMDKKV